MTAITLDDLGKSAALTIYPTEVISGDFSNVKLMSILDYRDAGAYIDVAAIHAAVYPTLPPGTPNDYTQYRYLKVSLLDRSETVLGLPWIQNFDILESVRLQIIFDALDASQVNVIRRLLIANNITDFSSKII